MASGISTSTSTSSSVDVNPEMSYFEDKELVLLQEFMVCIISRSYETALEFAQKILTLNPKNRLIQNYIPLLTERIDQIKSLSEDEDSSSEDDDEESGSDDESESSSDNDDDTNES